MTGCDKSTNNLIFKLRIIRNINLFKGVRQHFAYNPSTRKKIPGHRREATRYGKKRR